MNESDDTDEWRDHHQKTDAYQFVCFYCHSKINVCYTFDIDVPHFAFCVVHQWSKVTVSSQIRPNGFFSFFVSSSGNGQQYRKMVFVSVIVDIWISVIVDICYRDIDDNR